MGVMHQKDKNTGYLGKLATYSLIPVQHFPRLPLLFKEIAENFKKMRPDDAPKSEATLLAEKLRSTAENLSTELNERVRTRDHKKQHYGEQVTSNK